MTSRNAVERYIVEGYEQVRGMSSRFAARICTHLLHRQTALGIGGPVAEIGAFEGRFFIALALSLAPGEQAVALDRFDWPDEGLEARFHANCARHGVEAGAYRALKADTAELSPAGFASALDGQPARFVHIDGDHRPESLAHDLAIVHGALHPQGVICLDDMLHPGYPFLVVTVQAYLQAHPEMRLLCVIDREDIVAAPKFLLCRSDAVALYEDDLMRSFQAFQYLLGGDALGHHCVVLTPSPRLAEID